MKGQKLKYGDRNFWFSVEKSEYEPKCSKMTGTTVRKLLELGAEKAHCDADYRRVAIWYRDHRIVEANVDKTMMIVNAAAWDAAGLTRLAAHNDFQADIN